MKPDLSGLEIGFTTSAGEQVAAWAAGARVVKIFNTTGYNNMANPDNTAYYNPALALQMQAKLDQKMAQTGVTYQPNSPFCTIPSTCPQPPS